MIPMSVAQTMWVSGAAPSGEIKDGMVQELLCSVQYPHPG